VARALGGSPPETGIWGAGTGRVLVVGQARRFLGQISPVPRQAAIGEVEGGGGGFCAPAVRLSPVDMWKASIGGQLPGLIPWGPETFAGFACAGSNGVHGMRLGWMGAWA